MRLKIVKPGKAVTTTYSCKDFTENFRVLYCSKQALTAIDEVLGPQVWDVVRCDKAIAADIDHSFEAQRRADRGALEFLLRHNALVLTPNLCAHISEYAREPTLYKDRPHILSLIDYYNEEGFPISEAISASSDDDKEEKMLSLTSDDVVAGRVDRLHSLLEFYVPAESSCTMREDGLLDEPRPPPHIVEKRAKMVLDVIRGAKVIYVGQAGLSLQHYLFHELQLDIEEVSKHCAFCVIFLGPTSPPTLVDKVLQIVHANFPNLDIDKWKELFKHDVYPVPAYYGDQDKEGIQSFAWDKMDKFRKSLEYCRPDEGTYRAYSIIDVAPPSHATLEYLRPWFRLSSAMFSEETKFSMSQAIELWKGSNRHGQAMLEADMIRINDELRDEWCHEIETDVYLSNLSRNLFPLYLKWYEHTKDQELQQVLQVVLFAFACVTNRINEAKRVLLDMLQPPSGQDPSAKVSRRRVYLLTMAACTRNLPFVKWVFSQIQAAFPLEPSKKIKDLGHVSGPGRTKIEWRNHKLTMPAWQNFMTDLIPVDEFDQLDDRCPRTALYDPFVYLTNHVLDPPCPKYLMETGLLFAQTDPLVVLPLISRIVIMKQQNISVWHCQGYSFYDSPREEHNAHGNDDDDDDDDNAEDDQMWNRDLNGTNPAWAWGPITLMKLIELIADETNGIADTILSAKEQTEGIGVKGSRALNTSGGGHSDSK